MLGGTSLAYRSFAARIRLSWHDAGVFNGISAQFTAALCALLKVVIWKLAVHFSSLFEVRVVLLLLGEARPEVSFSVWRGPPFAVQGLGLLECWGEAVNPFFVLLVMLTPDEQTILSIGGVPLQT